MERLLYVFEHLCTVLVIIWWLIMTIIAIRKLYLVIEDAHKNDDKKLFKKNLKTQIDLFTVIIILISSLLPLLNWIVYEYYRNEEKKTVGPPKADVD